jgi:hypothetical protein
MHFVEIADHKDSFNRPVDAAWQMRACPNDMDAITHAKSFCLFQEILRMSPQEPSAL